MSFRFFLGRINLGVVVLCQIFFFSAEVFCEDGGEEGVVSQGEFAKLLVERLNLTKGVPAQVRVEDYFSLLRGGESVKVEAEVAGGGLFGFVKNTFPEGGFWISTEKGMGRLDYLLEFPFSGIYWLRVRAKGSSQFWTVDTSRTEILHPRGLFQWLDLGAYVLSRGKHRVTVALPSKSGLDQFLFSADNLRDVTPSSGWEASGSLTYGIMAEVMVRLMNYENKLPVDETYIFKYKILEKRFSTDINYAVGKFYLVVEDSGVYTVSADVRGDKPITFYIKGGRRTLNPLLKEKGEQERNPMYASLSEGGVKVKFQMISQGLTNLQEIDSAYFKKGEYVIETVLPPHSSVETFERLKRRSTSQDYLEILKGLGIRVKNADDPVLRSEVEEALSNEEFLRAATLEVAAPPLFEYKGAVAPPKEKPVLPLGERLEELEVEGAAGPTVLSPVGEEKVE